jgi:hypothetical protein
MSDLIQPVLGKGGGREIAEGNEGRRRGIAEENLWRRKEKV